WDEDADNGFRPPGLIRASTTIAPPEGYFNYLLDHGADYGSAAGDHRLTHPATHHLTLYRDPSGALVFSAGTINWSWGLDINHDFDPDFFPNPAPSTPELAMRQAMVNLFADMCDAAGQHCVQPRTLQPGLVPATASTDSAPP